MDLPWWEDPEIAEWQHGLCDTYAFAMIELYPHLRLGVAEFGQHFFTHDDQYAYDSIGRHPLPYSGVDDGFGFSSTLNENPSDYKTSSCPYGENAGIEDYDRAKSLIPKQHPWLEEVKGMAKIDRSNEFTREEVADAVADARKLIEQNERRSETSVHATLGENDALFRLHLTLKRMFDRINNK